MKHYVADICISASISVPKGDEKTYYELLMEIINTEENQDDIEEISSYHIHQVTIVIVMVTTIIIMTMCLEKPV